MSLKIVAGLFLAGLASLAQAQSYSVAEQHMAVGDWTFTPILKHATGSTTTEAFLVLRADSTIVGDNIASVFYVRDTASSTGWAAFGWATQDQWAAIEWLKGEYSISATMDDRWRTDQAQSSPTPVEPASFEDGVLEGDPLAPVLSIAPNRDDLIDVLVSAGYAAGDIPGEEEAFEAACPNSSFIGLGSQVIDSIEATNDVEGAEEDFNDAILSCVGFCIPFTVAGKPSTPSCAASTAWGAPTQSGVTTVWCTYSRSRTCSQNRLVVKRGWDCSITICFQGRSRTETETASCNDTGTLYNGSGTHDPCPLVPSCFGTGGPFTPTTTGAWSAWSPAC